MNRLSTYFGLSFLANALLLGLVLSTSRLTESESANQNKPSLPANGSPASISATAGGNDQTGAPGAIKLWEALNTEDLPALVLRLRAAGFPELLVRTLISQKVNNRFAARLKAVRPNNGDLPYWQSGMGRIPDAKAMAEYEKTWKEMQQMVTDLVGKPEETTQQFFVSEPWRTDFLPPGKIKAMAELQDAIQDFYRNQLERTRKPGEDLNKDEQAKLKALQQKQQDDIARLLTPTELAEYNLRTSQAASILTQDLKTFRPTEAEYRALYPVYQSGYDQLKNPAAPDGDGWTSNAAKALRSTKQAEIEAVLGPDRYADYVQATQPNARELNMITERLGLPLSAAAEVTNVEKDITQRAQDIQKSTTLTNEQKTQQITALSTEAEVAITTVLGADGFGAYKQHSGGWLGKLQGASPARRP